MTTTAGVVIIGGGVMGCSIAYNLAARGMPGVLLLEREVLGSGSTGRSTASVHTHYSTEVLARMAWHSLQVFRNFDDLVGGQCGFTETGHLVFAGEGDCDQVGASVALQQEAGIETSIINRQDAAEIAPGFHLDDCAAIVYEPLSGHADASGTALAYASRARQLGVTIELRSPATGLEITGGKIAAVVTGKGRTSTERVIVAAGPWSRDLLAQYGISLPLKVTRHQVAAFRRPSLSPSSLPGASDMVNQIYFRPEGAGMVLVGGGGPGDTVEDPALYGHRPTQGFIESVWTRLAKRIPMMEKAEYATGFAGLYTSTPDRHPVMDRVAGIEGLYLCTGFSGHGFKLAPAVGAIMTELVLDGRASTIDISPLRLSRFQPGPGNQNTSSYGANVVV
ncbi:MAG: FAD-binding oxidoreductase [Chloroflexi bacterium]|nr:FAD-binding oxidoreductase [Chloroflexota bacterium]